MGASILSRRRACVVVWCIMWCVMTVKSDDESTSLVPTALPTPIPTAVPTRLRSLKDTETETSGGLGLGTGALVGIALAIAALIMLPCVYLTMIVCANPNRIPDFGALGASAKYDERRGQLYGSILVVTLLNFIALIFAILAASDDADLVTAFAFALVRTDNGDLGIGLKGYVHISSNEIDDATYYAYVDALPRDDEVDYDWDFIHECKKAGSTAYGALFPIIITKLFSAFFAYKRLDPRADSTFYKWAATIVEFFSAVLTLSMLIDFSFACLSKLPRRGDEIFMPVDDDYALATSNYDDDVQETENFFFTTDDVRDRIPFTSFYFLIFAGLLSIYVAWVQLRLPTWNAELIYPDY